MKQQKPKVRRLFWDIETSPNIVYSWRVGYKINIDHDNIVEERKIVCIAYKWQGEKEVHALHWDAKHSDKKMLEQFIPVLESADEVVAHYGDKFDLPWVRARAAYHGIPVDAYIKSVDTKAQSSRSFYFNSNRLDYLGEYLGLGRKIKTDFSLWKGVMESSAKALAQMVTYCKQDVRLLEQVYLRLEGYNKPKTHVAVLSGGSKSDCPQCGSSKVQRRGYRVTTLGVKSQIMSCTECGRNYTAAVVKEASEPKTKVFKAPRR